ncbi:IS21 family transposase [Bacillus thuringiensis]|uniref:IS21 family transposase n=1 Tax=Bacillus thuringiensis TaxID=1428 RepID=UPI003BF62D78
MISLKKKQKVLIDFHQNGKSQRTIAKELGISRNTVKKYIDQDLLARKEDTRKLPISTNSVMPPAYKKRVSPKKVLTKSAMSRICEMLKQNKQKRLRNMHKQQLKIVDIHEKLLDEGFKISYTTVRNFISTEEKRQKEVFIRQKPTAGQEIEFDWGEVKLFIHEKYRKYSLALFTLPYSNQRFGYLYESETMICVQDVHVKCIEHLQFVPAVFIYDNMRTVVKNFIGTEREITDGMKNLSLHYQFKIRLCEPRKGNQKGHVERSVEYVRRKAFSHCDTFTSLEEAQQHLATTLQKLNSRNHYLKHISHHELMQEERQSREGSLSVAAFDVSDLHEIRVDKYSTITYRQNHYSVPEGHVGEYVKIKASAEQILIFNNGECIAKHKRCWQSHQWIMDIYHYLQTFEKKKGALAQSECLQQAPKEIKRIYQNHYIGNERDFLTLLFYVKENGEIEKVLKAVSQLEKNQLVQLTTEKIIFLAEQESVTVKLVQKSDEVASQSIENLSVITALFDSKKIEVLH